MNPLPVFEGPRLVLPDEWSGSQHLSQVCFEENDFTFPPEGQESPTVPARRARPPGETYVIAAQGKPVSQISIFFTPLRIHDSSVKVGSIGGVCTHPDFRGHGLASRLMQHCTTRLWQGGARLMVISGGRGLYTRLGSVPMGKFAAFTLPGPIRPAFPAVNLRAAAASDAALCSRLYQCEPLHFTRPLRRFSGRFQEHETGFHAEDWIIEMDGQAAAYLLLNVPWDNMDEPGMPVRCIFEYAGSRLALAGALAAVAAMPGIREVQAPVPWQDTDLAYLMAQSLGKPEWTSLPDHTIRVINFPGLMADLKAYIQARLESSLRRGLKFEQLGPLLDSAGEDRYAITRGNDRLELNGAAMTRLVVGAPDSELPRAPGALSEILAALFPLPAFFTGIDYH